MQIANTGVAPDVTQLAAATSVGDDPRTSETARAIYLKLRDKRSTARSLERQDAQSIEGVEDKKTTLRPEWRDVAELAELILKEHARDVEALVWLTEAKTRLDGFAGTAECFWLVDHLVKNFGMSLHSVPDTEGAERFAPLASLNGLGRDGTLVQPLRLLPLAPGAEYGEHTLWHLQTLENKKTTESAILDADRNSALGRLGEIEDCMEAIEALDATMSDLLGPDAPPMNRLIDIVDDANRGMRNLLGASGESLPDNTEPDEAEVTQTAPAGPARVTTRDEAFNQLLVIAEFFRRTEPHSPMAPALETLVRRGRLDFISLMTELIPDENTRRSFLTTAGIKSADTE